MRNGAAHLQCCYKLLTPNTVHPSNPPFILLVISRHKQSSIIVSANNSEYIWLYYTPGIYCSTTLNGVCNIIHWRGGKKRQRNCGSVAKQRGRFFKRSICRFISRVLHIEKRWPIDCRYVLLLITKYLLQKSWLSLNPWIYKVLKLISFSDFYHFICILLYYN